MWFAADGVLPSNAAEIQIGLTSCTISECEVQVGGKSLHSSTICCHVCIHIVLVVMIDHNIFEYVSILLLIPITQVSSSHQKEKHILLLNLNGLFKQQKLFSML